MPVAPGVGSVRLGSSDPPCGRATPGAVRCRANRHGWRRRVKLPGWAEAGEATGLDPDIEASPRFVPAQRKTRRGTYVNLCSIFILYGSTVLVASSGCTGILPVLPSR